MYKSNMTKNAFYSERALRLIPGGAHTYSKGDDQFPLNAPKIIDRGLGSDLWDVDGNKYIDMAMSLGTTILGHAYEPVLEAVRKELNKGVNFCRPSVIEGELAELITSIIPSADMVKFGKNGSDAVTASVKLARAYTRRSYIARCSSDPFNAIHDWFIGSTVIDRGVPEEVKNLTLIFDYNDIESCQKLFDKHPQKIAAFILEPISFIEPKNNFLQQLKELCEKNGALLIFDEVVSGFRFSLAGAQGFANVTPHLSAFGKAMGNGFSVSALTGQKEFMKLGGLDHDEERVFLLSTTYGGETHSIAAAIKTIHEIIDKKAISHFWQIGKKFIQKFNQLAVQHNIQKLVFAHGYPCKPAISFNDIGGNPFPAIRTLFIQEMIAHNVLIPYLVPSLAHNDETLSKVMKAVNNAFKVISDALNNEELEKKINGYILKPVFRKFN